MKLKDTTKRRVIRRLTMRSSALPLSRRATRICTRRPAYTNRNAPINTCFHRRDRLVRLLGSPYVLP